jgi:molecular chaperone DnaK
MIHATEKSVKELGDQVSADEKAGIDAAIEALKNVLKSDDKAEIEAKTEALAELSGKMAERVYAQKGATEETHAPGNAESSSAHAADDGVVDAEFEEVKDDDKK